MDTVSRISQLGDYVTPIALRVICDLGIPDHLADGPRDASALARLTGANVDALYRTMRALSGSGVFSEDREHRFALTELSDVLRSDHPYSMRRMFQLIKPEMQAWTNFDHTIMEGADAFALTHGVTYWELIGQNEHFRGQFEAAIWNMTEHELRAVLPAYPWGKAELLVDLGGGTGQLVAGVLQANPSLRAILFDLPTVAPHALPLLREKGVADRCEIVSGDFFVSVPSGGDLYLLKRVFYDFDDDQAVAILSNVRKAMGPGSRVLTLDGLARSDNRYDVGKWHDLFVLGLGRGRCRTRKEIAAIFEEAGLRLGRIIPTGVFPLVEGLPA